MCISNHHLKWLFISFFMCPNFAVATFNSENELISAFLSSSNFILAFEANEKIALKKKSFASRNGASLQLNLAGGKKIFFSNQCVGPNDCDTLCYFVQFYEDLNLSLVYLSTYKGEATQYVLIHMLTGHSIVMRGFPAFSLNKKLIASVSGDEAGYAKRLVEIFEYQNGSFQKIYGYSPSFFIPYDPVWVGQRSLQIKLLKGVSEGRTNSYSTNISF